MIIETAQVRFHRPYQGYKTGQVVTVAKGVARSLVLFGKAEMVEQLVVETAVAPESARLETAVAPVAKAPRRRRAKL
jgi:hypothetical protein